ncbi:protein-export chaperone SecB [Hyphomicrobium methylovorum]|uniref:protein-export chaperone SecB n=1 Tax=Hyphomicrobium methylovorum TaxID=84 RepID=UPI0015E6FC5D|nr:protein-export chaperone SecB [Hyphomicrobium methylovorum]MBA2126127.1 protein-export chaperone SecB [Hyphomicrobium methylovorum]
MAENGNGAAGATSETAPPPIQAKIVSQYVKDLSFENPNVRKLISGKGDQPNIQVEVNVGAQRVENDLFESSIEFKATATNNLGTIYVIETVYAGLMKIESIPEESLEPFLLISGPTMVFPFLRRLVADVTREGGFPPLLLDPIDFASLYMRRQQQQQAEASKANA